MKNLIKKQYEKPAIDVIIMKMQAQLLQASTETIALGEEEETTEEQW